MNNKLTETKKQLPFTKKEEVFFAFIKSDKRPQGLKPQYKDFEFFDCLNVFLKLRY